MWIVVRSARCGLSYAAFGSIVVVRACDVGGMEVADELRSVSGSAENEHSIASATDPIFLDTS